MYSIKFRTPKNCIDMNGQPIQSRAVGEPYDGAKKEKNSRWNGKQMTTAPAAKPHCDATQKGYFTKLVYQHEEYFSQIPYTKTQPADQRKLGFGSKDAFKTDEFTNTIATEVYRDTLRKEQKMKKRSDIILAKRRQAAGEEEPEAERLAAAELAANEEESNAPTLYDLTHDDSMQTYGSERRAKLLPRDRLMRLGPCLPMSYDIGFKCDDGPTIARNRSTCGNSNATSQFFDPGHMQLGAFAVKKPEDSIGE